MQRTVRDAVHVGDVAHDARAESIEIEVPSDFQELLARSPSSAVRWHGALSQQFLWALGEGYVVTGLHRDRFTARSYYLLETR